MALAYGATIGTPVKNTAASSTTIAMTTSATVPSGGFIVLLVSWYHASATASVSGGSLSWAKDVQKTGTADTGHQAALFSAQAPSGLASGTTITATFSSASFGRAIMGDYWTGVATSSVVDQTSTAQFAGSVSAWNGGNVTTTNADDLIVVGGWFDAMQTTNTPTSPATEIEDTNLASDASTWAMEYRIVSATGTYSLAGTWAATTGTVGAETVAVQVAYKAAGGTNATVTAVAATAAGSAPVAAVSAGGAATVSAVPATALGSAPAAAVSAGVAVTAPAATALGSAPPANNLVSVVVNAPAVIALGSAPIAAVSAGGSGATVTAVPATARGSAPVAAVSAGASVSAVPAVAAGSAPVVTVVQGITVSAVPAVAVGMALRPTISPLPAGGAGTATVAATFAEDSA